MRGVDISAYQGTVDFDALAAALPGGFVIAKATEGTSFIDAQFARNWTEAKRVGLRRGAYHFAVPDLGSRAQDEARHFLSILGPLDASDILALDYERDWTGDVVGWCLEWLELVRSVTGITPYLYLNLYLAHVYDWGTIERAGGFPIWLADYDGQPDTVIETPWPRVAIKQYTSAGTMAGISGLVDLNSMEEDDMSPEQLKAILDKLDDVADSAAIYAGRAARGLDPITGSPLDPAKRLVDPVAEIQAARAADRAGHS